MKNTECWENREARGESEQDCLTRCKRGPWAALRRHKGLDCSPASVSPRLQLRVRCSISGRRSPHRQPRMVALVNACLVDTGGHCPDPLRGRTCCCPREGCRPSGVGPHRGCSHTEPRVKVTPTSVGGGGLASPALFRTRCRTRVSEGCPGPASELDVPSVKPPLCPFLSPGLEPASPS